MGWMKNRWVVSLTLGTTVSLVALYLAFRNVPVDDLLGYLADIDYWWVFPSTAVILAAFACRVLRWQIIVSASDRIGFWDAHHPLMIGFMMNCILPGRVGEVARPIILQKRERVPFSTGLATVATERLFDLVFLIGIFAVVLSAVDIDPSQSKSFGEHILNKKTLESIAGGMVKLCLVLVAGILFMAWSKTRGLLTRTVSRIPDLFAASSPRLRDILETRVCRPVIRITENLASGFSLVHRPGRMLVCLGLSFLVWLLSAVSYYTMAMGSPGIGLSFFELTTVMAIVCFFIALPSVPGFWGLWEAGGVFALAVFGIPEKEALGFTLANHAVQMFPVIVVGLVSAVITGVSILQVSKESRKAE